MPVSESGPDKVCAHTHSYFYGISSKLLFALDLFQSTRVKIPQNSYFVSRLSGCSKLIITSVPRKSNQKRPKLHIIKGLLWGKPFTQSPLTIETSSQVQQLR